jgi:hypothetical protein
MLYDLLVPLAKYYGAFNVFRYITFRTAMAAVTAIIISFALGPWLIRRLSVLQHGGETIREAANDTGAGTPTMGAGHPRRHPGLPSLTDRQSVRLARLHDGDWGHRPDDALLRRTGISAGRVWRPDRLVAL